MKQHTVEDQIGNCLVAMEMVRAIPPKQFTPGLSSWVNHCGSAFCFGGFVAVHPYFRRKGVRRNKVDGSPEFKHRPEDPDYVARVLFGSPNMFRPGDQSAGTEKQEVLDRLKSALNSLIEEDLR